MCGGTIRVNAVQQSTEVEPFTLSVATLGTWRRRIGVVTLSVPSVVEQEANTRCVVTHACAAAQVKGCTLGNGDEVSAEEVERPRLK